MIEIKFTQDDLRLSEEQPIDERLARAVAEALQAEVEKLIFETATRGLHLPLYRIAHTDVLGHRFLGIDLGCGS